MRPGEIDRQKGCADRDLQERQQTFIEPENWLPISPDLNPVYYSVWGGSCNRWCVITQFQTDQLKHMLIDYWAQLSQDTLN